MSWWIAFLSAAVVAGTPLLFASLGGILCERVGNQNLGIEGMMLMGAVAGFITAVKTSSPIAAMAAAALAGLIGALIYAVLAITMRTNQVVTGLTLTMFGTGLANFLGKPYINLMTPTNVKAFFTAKSIPILGDIPIIGPIFFKQDIFIYFGYLTVLVLGFYLFKTRPGLNMRAVGQNPAAADAASINVTLYKYVHVLLGGALCGLGGAYLSLVYVPSWQENITAGLGWIAVALIIFATWNPYKAVFGSYLFGGLTILGFRLQGAGMHINQYLVDMTPYIVTILVLVLVSQGHNPKNAPPKSLGEPYFREER